MKKQPGPSAAVETDEMTLVRLACQALEEKKGAEITVLDVRGLSNITDFHVLVSGSSPPHLKALHAAVVHAFKQQGCKCYRKAGDPESGWMILDYAHVVVHVFLPSTRDYYALEKLWPNAPRPEFRQGRKNNGRKVVMDAFEAMESRFSYRGSFLTETVPQKDLRRIVEAGLQAPSGCNAQTTTFVIVDDPEKVETIRALPGANKAVAEAPAFLACFVDRDPPPVYRGSLSFQVEDCAAAVENMLLAITALGYASVWIDGWLRVENRAEAIEETLEAPAGKTVRVLLPVGRPAEPGGERKQKKPFEARAAFNHHG